MDANVKRAALEALMESLRTSNSKKAAKELT